MALASLARTIGYIQGASLRRNRLYIKSTGAEIRITWGFVKSVWSAFVLYAYIVGVCAYKRVLKKDIPMSVCFYPEQPAPWYTFWSVSQFLGLKITHDIENADIVCLFEDKTYSNIAAHLPEAVTPKRINGGCVNISKQKVAQAFLDAFGYDLDVDPTAYVGKAVEKSDLNGKHDGQVIQCPAKASDITPGRVYQKLINNSKDGITVQDIRLTFVGGEIPCVYLKHRDIQNRFANENIKVEFKEPHDVLSDEEIRNVKKMAHMMGLDFGGIDVLRNETDGRIYVVDVNKTCMSPPIALPFKDKIEAIRRLSRVFRHKFI